MLQGGGNSEIFFRLQTACFAFSIFDISVVKSLMELTLKFLMILLCISITASVFFLVCYLLVPSNAKIIQYQ